MKNGIIKGQIKRLAQKINPKSLQISVYAEETSVDGVSVHMRELVTFEISTYLVESLPYATTLCNLAVGDVITVEFEKDGDELRVVNMENEPELGRPVADWLKDVEKSQEYWRDKGAKF